MEMVVVTAIFSVTITVVTTILVNNIRNQRQVKAEQIVVSAARDAIEILAREIRLGYVNYTEHIVTDGDDLSTAQEHLYVTSQSGVEFEFKLDSANGDRLVGVESGDEQPLSSTDIIISNLSFYIQPSTDPYYIKSCSDASDCDPTSIPVVSPGNCTASGICEIEDIQPRVTIILRAETRDAAPGQFATIDLQTTVASRTYLR